jgi:hypothetical protein
MKAMDALVKARRATNALGWLVLVFGSMLVVFAMLDSASETSEYLVSGLVMVSYGAAMLYGGHQLNKTSGDIHRALRALVALHLLALVLCIVAVVSGDVRSLLPMLITALLLSYYVQSLRKFPGRYISTTRRILARVVFPFYNARHDFLLRKWWIRLVIVLYGSFLILVLIKVYSGIALNSYCASEYHDSPALIQNCFRMVQDSKRAAIVGAIALTTTLHYVIQLIFFKIIVDFVALGGRRKS